MFCQRCGAKISKNMIKCPHCGGNIFVQEKKPMFKLYLALLFLPMLAVPYMWIARDDIDKDMKKKLSIAAGIWLLIALFYPTKSTRTETPQPVVTTQTMQTETKVNNSPAQAQVQEDIRAKLVDFPESIDGIESYIISAIDDKYKNATTIDVDPSTNTPGGYIVAVTITSNDLGLESSKAMAKNVIVATYNAIYEKNLPIIYVSYQTETDRGRLFIMGIGKNIAEKAGREKWNIHSNSSSFSVDELVDFARINQNQAITSDGKTHFENRCFMKY